MFDFTTDPTWCPWCHAEHDGALNTTGDDSPKTGDPTVCADCGRLSVYDAGVPHGRRFPTLAERRGFEADPDVRRALAAVAAVRRQHQAKVRPWN